MLGTRLRHLREASEITSEAAGRAIAASPSRISGLEAGRAAVRITDVEGLLTVYGVDHPAARAEYLGLARLASATGPQLRWLDTYLTLEDSATHLRCYAPAMIPDLLQTAAYAREVLALAHPDAEEADLERRLDLLHQRQRILTRPDPPRLWVVIEQVALRRQLGRWQVWRDQLAHLAQIADRPNIIVQIMPDHAGGPIISPNGFTILRFADASLTDIVHTRHATGTCFLHRHDELSTYRQTWDRLCLKAIAPNRTSDIVTAAAAGSPL
ncbi:helix-turn-helix domain-containing protein [Nocardia sp. NEAU-G5]|uniref:Helix-turn-helix domain-containing protein n=1 Tax=Nocardia albiluteola TaxID=2842303 RepID=A0ABS6B1S4_9NOCA|nr:helix-turn-helix transcriptional regulator [Nocardia albiluteola]MBU3064252.1 helix-turn-helix domain-containing protein [Nocardia albiluteola]